MINANNGPDSIAIGFGSSQMETQGAISGVQIIAEKISGAVVGGEQKIHVAIAVEVGEGETATDTRRGKISAVGVYDILKFPIAEVQE